MVEFNYSGMELVGNMEELNLLVKKKFFERLLDGRVPS